jgi:hypothetical protein
MTTHHDLIQRAQTHLNTTPDTPNHRPITYIISRLNREPTDDHDAADQRMLATRLADLIRKRKTGSFL